MEITTKTLWDQRRYLLGWALGLGAAALVYTGSYAVFDVSTLTGIADSIPPDLAEAFGWTDFTSASGYLGSTVFGLVVPVLTMIFAIGAGARFLAGDEEDGVLELTAAHPVSRSSLVLQKAAALTIECLLMGVVVFVVVAGLLGPTGIDVPVSSVAAATLQLVLLGLVMGATALAVGGFVGRRGVVLGVAAAVAVFAFFADTIVRQVDGLAWIEDLSFFHYYGGSTVLDEGLVVGDSLVLAGSIAVLVALAVVGFRRRDIGV